MYLIITYLGWLAEGISTGRPGNAHASGKKEPLYFNPIMHKQVLLTHTKSPPKLRKLRETFKPNDVTDICFGLNMVVMESCEKQTFTLPKFKKITPQNCTNWNERKW